MFGYISPLVAELKVKEHEAYKGYYCGLCKAIKENYTNAARMLLNYDCAALSLLMGSMSSETPTVGQERCAANPLKKKAIVRTGHSEYAAAVNVMLGVGKIRDTAADDKKLYARILAVFFSRVDKRAQRAHGHLAAEFALRMGSLQRLEREKCGDIDEVADEFAHLLGAVFSLAPFDFLTDNDRKALRHFGYNIGRWLYIIDAVDDLEEDDKKGRYNVFLQREYSGAAQLKEDIKEEAKFNLHYSLSEACKAYELLDIKRDKALLDNIMYLGLAKKTEDILQGRAANCGSPETERGTT